MNFSDFISLTFFFAVSMIMKFERKRFFWWNSSIKSVQYVCNINFGFYRFSTFWFLSWYSYRFFYVRSQTSLNCIIQGGHVLKLRSARGCRAIFFNFFFLAFWLFYVRCQSRERRVYLKSREKWVSLTSCPDKLVLFKMESLMETEKNSRNEKRMNRICWSVKDEISRHCS